MPDFKVIPTVNGTEVALVGHDHAGYIHQDGTIPLTANWDIGDGFRLMVDGIRARDTEGLRIENAAGNLGLFVADSGNVGVGTQNVEQKLTLQAEGTGVYLQSNTYRDAAASGGIMLRHARGTAALPTALLENDQLGQVLFYGYDGSDWDMSAAMIAYMDGVDSTRFQLMVRNAGTNIYPFTVKSSGNVGIGTPSPEASLHVLGSSITAVIQADETTPSLIRGQIQIRGATDANQRLSIGFNTTDGYGWMQTGISGTGYRQLILNSLGGNVGIGTTVTLDRLHVSDGDSGITPHAYSTMLVEDNTNAAITIGTPNTSTGYLFFGDPEQAVAGQISYNHPNNRMGFVANNIAVMYAYPTGVTAQLGLTVGQSTVTHAHNRLMIDRTDASGAAVLSFSNGTEYMFWFLEPTGSGGKGHIRTDSSRTIVLQDSSTSSGGVGVGITPTTKLGVQAGSSSNDAAVGGILYVGVTSIGNVGSPEYAVGTFNVPANTLAVNGQSLWFEAAGTTAANANAKAIIVRFGTAGVTFVGSMNITSSSGRWMVKGRIYRTGANLQTSSFMGVAGLTDTGVYSHDVLNQNLSAAVPLRIMADGVANNDIICHSFIVGWDDRNT